MTPVRLVTTSRADALVAWLAQTASPRRALLINDANLPELPLSAVLGEPGVSQALGFVAVKSVSGCACCLGALPVRVALTQLLRQGCSELVVVSTHWAHLASLERALLAPPLDTVTQALESLVILSDSDRAPEKQAVLNEIFGSWSAKWVFAN